MPRTPVDGRIFNAAGKPMPGMEQFAHGPAINFEPVPIPDPNQVRVNNMVQDMIRPVATPAKSDLLGQRATGAGSKPGPLPAAPAAPAFTPTGTDDLLKRTLAGMGQKMVNTKQVASPPLTPQQSFIKHVADAANVGIDALVPMAGPIRQLAKSEVGQGVAKGMATLAITMLGSYDDLFGRHKTADDSTEAKLREQAQAEAAAKGTNVKTVVKNYTESSAGKSAFTRANVEDQLNAAASGLLARLTAGGASRAAKIGQGAGIAMFGAQVVASTPDYIQQIASVQDPTERYSLATQLLGSYFLVGYGAYHGAKSIPTTKTLKGQSEFVPLDLNAAVEFTRSPNPDLTPIQKQAFQELYQKGGTAVKDAIRAGGTEVTAPDVTVPTVYGRMMTYVQSKLRRQEPLTPEEMKVQAAVAESPGTLVPRPETLVKDPAALESMRQATQPAEPQLSLRQMARVNLPEQNIQSMPTEVSVPVPPARRQPLGSLVQVQDLMTRAASAESPEAFIQAVADVNPASLRGFKTSDGVVVDGPGTAPQTFQVADTKTKQIVDRPAAEILTDFYRQAKGEAVAPGRDTNVPTKVNEPAKPVDVTEPVVNKKRLSKRGQAAADRAQREINAGTSDREKLDALAAEHAGMLRQIDKEVGGVTTVPGENGKRLRKSTNSPFYSQYYKENGKPPTKAAYMEEARRQLLKGTDERSRQYQELDAKVNPPATTYEQDQKAMADFVASIKFKKASSNESQLRTVEQATKYLHETRPSTRKFEFTEVMPNYAAAMWEPVSKKITAALGENNKGEGIVNIMHVGHEVGHEIFNDILNDAERKEFTDLAVKQFAGREDDIIHKIIAYGYDEQPDYAKYNFEKALSDLAENAGGLLSNMGHDYSKLEFAYKDYRDQVAKHGQLIVDRAIKENSTAGRALLRYFHDIDKALETKNFTETVREEIFSDLNGEYVANRTGKWTDQMRQWFSDLWNSIRKIAGLNYDKLQEVFRRSYEGRYKTSLEDMNSDVMPPGARAKMKLSDEDAALAEFNKAAAKVSAEVEAGKVPGKAPLGKRSSESPKLRDDDELWAARFAAIDENPRPLPPALGDIKIGETRKLFDPESTPGQDYAAIAAANKPDTPKAAVENYDGLLELRRLKGEERIKTIFKGIDKKADEELFKGAMEYQVDGTTTLQPELQKVFNQVTKLFDSIGQDAFASGRIRGLRENYITQIWDTENIPDTSLTPEQIAFLKGASSATTKFALERTIKNYKMGIELGLKPKYTKLSEIVREYIGADARAAAGRFMADDIIALGTDYAAVGGGGLPLGWRPVNKIAGLKGYFVSPETYKAIKALDTISAIRTSRAGRVALKVNELTKQVILAGDLFLLKNYLFDAFQASALGPVRLVYEASKITPELQANLVALGGMKLSKGNPEQANSLFGKVGRKLLSPKNPYFWADTLSFALGDKLRMGTAAMSYNKLVKKGVPEAEAARRAARFAQDTFGRQNLVRAGQSQTVQDVMKLAIMAPDYTTARFRTMGKAAAGATFKIRDSEYRQYTYGFIRKMLIAGFIFEALNLSLSGHTSDQNDEDHKWDLEVKKPDGSKYYVNFLGVLKTDLRFIQGLADASQGDLTTITRFIGNKGSTIERVAQLLITGKDYRGEDIVNKYTDDPAEKWQKLGLSLANNFVPLPIQGLTSPNTRGEGPAPRGIEGFVYRTLGFDVYDPKKMPTVVRQSLDELEREKQNVILETYSLVKSGKGDEAAKLIDAFNARADATGNKLATLNGISEVDRQSLQELGVSAAIDRDKQIARAQSSADSGSKPNPISNLIDYGVAGTTIAGNKSTTGQEIAKANAVKSAATRRAKSGGTSLKVKKPRKVRVAKGGKAKRLSLKKGTRKVSVKSLKSKRKLV